MKTTPSAAWQRLAAWCAAGGVVLFLIRLALGTPPAWAAAVAAATAAAVFLGLALLDWFTRGLPKPGAIVTALLEGGMTRDAALDAVSDALSAMGVHHLHRKNGTVRGISRISAKSFGEVVEVSLQSSETGELALTFTATPRIRTTMLDYGHSAELADHFVRAFQQRFPSKLTVMRQGSLDIR